MFIFNSLSHNALNDHLIPLFITLNQKHLLEYKSWNQKNQTTQQAELILTRKQYFQLLSAQIVANPTLFSPDIWEKSVILHPLQRTSRMTWLLANFNYFDWVSIKLYSRGLCLADSSE